VLEQKQVQIDNFQDKKEAYDVINEAIALYKKQFGE
jgi:inorganic pyrophosphatase